MQCIMHPVLSQNIFYLHFNTLSGNTADLYPESAELTATYGNKFNVVKNDKLYYLNKVSAMQSKSLQDWQKILGRH